MDHTNAKVGFATCSQSSCQDVLFCHCRLQEAVRFADENASAAETKLPDPTWPWWIKLQAAFFGADVQKVRPSCYSNYLVSGVNP